MSAQTQRPMDKWKAIAPAVGRGDGLRLRGMVEEKKEPFSNFKRVFLLNRKFVSKSISNIVSIKINYTK
jgi:hypothetical protein